MSVSVKTGRGLREIEGREWLAALIAGAGGMINGGFLIGVGGSELWDALGIVGFLGIFTALTLIFPFLLCRFSYTFSLSAIFISSHSRILGGIIAPLVQVFGLASLATYAAFVLVGAFWIVFGVFVLPLALGTAFPNLSISFAIGCAAYALSLGGFYGIVLQDFL